MTDLRVIEAERIAHEWGLSVFPARCQKCSHPLLVPKGEREPLACYFCAIDERSAVLAKALLERLLSRGHYYHVGDETFYCEKEGCRHAA